MKVAIIGGTGKLGHGLALRWARDHEVAIGSRNASHARERAGAYSREAGVVIRGDTHLAVVEDADLVALALPYHGRAAIVAALAQHLARPIIVDMTVPLSTSRPTTVVLPPGRSAALELRDQLGANTRIVAALHHVSAARLLNFETPLRGDVLVCGDDEQAKEVVLGLIATLGMRGVDAGPLDNAVALESMTPVLLSINRRYQTRHAGLQIIGLP